MLGNQFYTLGMFFPILENSVGNRWDMFGIFLDVFSLFWPWEINVIYWERFSQCWKILWEIAGTSLGYFHENKFWFQVGKLILVFGIFYPNIGKYCGNHWELIGIFREINTVTVFLLENIQYHANRFSTFLTLVCFFNPPCIYFCQTARFLKRYQWCS